MSYRHTAMQRGLLPACIALALSPAFAGAQQAPAENATTLDKIEVTGSRIKRTDIETSQPVFILSRAEIDKQGLTSVADVLQRISTNGAALNTTFNNGGDGSSGISLRNLGEARTLVLVNGRRWTTQLSGSVDLNTIPAAVIERVEVLKDGASTIYGSDAIAGVVNIITRRDFDGAEAGAYFGQYVQGDGTRQAYDVTIGTSNDRSSLLFAASYVKEEAVMAGDRRISAGGPPFFGGQSGTGFPGSFVDPVDNKRYVLDANGKPVPYASAVHGYNTAPDNYLLTPQERTSLFAQGTFEITDRVTFRAEALYNERISEQLLAAMPVTGLELDPNSYYNPTNPAGFYKGSVPGGARNLIGVNRRFQESGGRSFNQNVKTWHFYSGLEGSFDFAGRSFDWNMGYRYDKSDENDLTYGLFNKTNLRNAYGPSFNDNGVIRCGTPGNVIEGCVPINPLGGLGSISKEALDYTSFTAHDSSSVVSKGYTVNITGDLFELPAGPLGFAAGYEYRNESGRYNPDAFIAAGLSTGNGSRPTAGSYSLNEFYVELAIPVLADLPGAKLLDFSLATRYSDYSNFGDTSNNKFGFRWKPIDDLMFRGNYTEGFRAPSINNLYAGDGDSYESYIDPCSSHSALRSNPRVMARCTAEGVPASFTQPGNGSSRQTLEPFTYKSNQQLLPETSTSKTLGFVYSPSWLQGFDIAVDWYKVEIENAITRPSSQDILDKCYAGTASEQAIYCSLYSRDRNYPGAPNIITSMKMPLMNLSSYEVEGYDVTLNYRLPETEFGKFSITWDSTYTSNWAVKAAKDSKPEQRQGLYLPQDPYWRIKSNLYFDWTKGPWGATWGVRYKSGIDEQCPFDGADAKAYCSDPNRITAEGAAPRNYLASTTYHDVQLRFNTPWNATVSLGANNVFDKAPPMSLTAPYNMFDQRYDLPGRYYYMKYHQRF